MADKKAVKEIIRIAAVLTIICTLVAAVVSGVYAVTKEPYEANLLKQKQEAMGRLFGSDSITAEKADDSLAPGIVGVSEINLVFESEIYLGCCVTSVSAGFGGDIELMVAVSPNNQLIGVEVISMSETPGLGARWQEADNLAVFADLDGTDALILNEDVDAISGATISSKAILKGVNAALDAARQINAQNPQSLKGGKPNE